MNKDYSTLPDNAWLRLSDVLLLTQIGRTKWYAGLKAGIFPQPLKVGKRANFWRKSDIFNFLKTGKVNTDND